MHPGLDQKPSWLKSVLETRQVEIVLQDDSSFSLSGSRVTKSTSKSTEVKLIKPRLTLQRGPKDVLFAKTSRRTICFRLRPDYITMNKEEV